MIILGGLNKLTFFSLLKRGFAQERSDCRRNPCLLPTNIMRCFLRQHDKKKHHPPRPQMAGTPPKAS